MSQFRAVASIIAGVSRLSLFFKPTFGGNPNAVVSSLGGNFTMSRTSGYVGIEPNGAGTNIPAFVQVSGAGITATGTITGSNGVSINVRPYQDLEFSWDFGDPSGTETFTHPVTGQTVNANKDQIGPEAAYAYRATGTYTIICQARWKDSGGAIRSQAFTQTFSVADISTMSGFTRHWYVDGVSGSDTTGSGTFAAPYATISKLMTVGFITDKSCTWFKRGSHWSDQGNILNTGGRATNYLRFGAYGSGAKPIIEISTQTINGSPINFISSNASLGTLLTMQDVVWSNLDCRVSNGGGATHMPVIWVSVNDAFNPYNAVNNLYLDTVDASANFVASVVGTQVIGFSVQASTPQFPGKQTGYGAGLWKCTSTVPTATPSYWETGWQGGGAAWCFSLGCSFTGAGGGFSVGTDLIHDHHIYTHTNKHLLHRWDVFGAGPNRNYCINYEVDPDISYDPGTSCNVTAQISGATGTGPDTATMTISTNSGPGVPQVGQFVMYMGGVTGGVAAQIASVTANGGNSYTCGISSAQGLANYATNQPFVLVSLRGSFQYTVDTASGKTAHIHIASGTETGTINVGDWIYCQGSSSQQGFVQSVVSVGSEYVIFNEGGVAAMASAKLGYAVPAQTPPNTAQYFCFNGNLLSGTENGISGNTSNNNAATTQIDDVVFEQNLISGLGGTGNNTGGGFTIGGYCNRSFTSRDNFWMCGGNGLNFTGFWDIGTGTNGNINALLTFAAYRNKLYIPSGAPSGNYAFAFQTTSLTSVLPLQFTDNIVQDDRDTVSSLVQWPVSGSNNVNCLIDRQAYYSAGAGGIGSDTGWNNGSMAQSFASWRANGANFDPNSTDDTASSWPATPTGFTDMGGFI